MYRTQCLLVSLFLPLLSCLQLVSAQSQAGGSIPDIHLEQTIISQGETLVLEARGLQAETSYQLSLEGPDGSGESEMLNTDAAGDLSYPYTPNLPGRWTLKLSGPEFIRTLTLEVLTATPEGSGASPPPGTAPPAEETTASAVTPESPTPAPPQNPTAAVGETQPVTTPEPPTSAPPPTEGALESPAIAEEPFVLEGNNLVARQGGEVAWRLDFPDESGPSNALTTFQDNLYLAHGNSVLKIEPESGVVKQRYLLSTLVTGLQANETGLTATVIFGSGLTQKFTLQEDGVQETVRFGADPLIFSWLRHEAEVPDPAARLLQDPTNPWLYLESGLAKTDVEGARADFEQVLEKATTFYDLAALSRQLFQAGQRDLANRAMEAALRDFARRGYTPELLTDPNLREAYGFPLSPLTRALERGDIATAGFWAEWVYQLSSPTVPATRQALWDYAQVLANAGQRDRASLWRARLRESRDISVATSLDRLFTTLSNSGWYAVIAILGAILMLQLTLLCKYWSPQTLVLRRRREAGRRAGPFARLFGIRYYSFTEKLVLVILYAAALVLAGLASWHDAGSGLPPAARSGSLASIPARDFITTGPLEGPRAAFLRGYAAQVADDLSAATEYYQEAEEYPPALNNLAAITGDEVLYQRALDLAPGLKAPAFNLGRIMNPSIFQELYHLGEPLLVAPIPADFQIALAGTWQRAIASTFQNPWSTLRSSRPGGLSTLTWQLILVIFLASAVLTVLWGLIPRPRLARNAPRVLPYHLLALIIPGTGLADELWGVLLLVPWTIVGLDGIAQLLERGWGFNLGLTTDTAALAILYAVNLIAFVVETSSYSRRMRSLRRNEPRLARAFGLRVQDDAAAREEAAAKG